MMYDQGKSDPPIVPGKSPNKAGRPAAEAMEGRGGAKGNAGQQSTRQTQSWVGVSQALDRIRQAARRDRKARFTALLHHVTVDLLRWAFLQLRRKAAPGADGVTWAQYEAGLEENLRDLHVRVQRGAYRAWPSRRQYIPKPDGRRRPLGVAALEDKIVQRAVVEVLNAIYETDFLGFSYGFRPGRSQHDALDALAVGLQRRKVNWVLDADIRAFFDSLSHAWLMRFLEHRIGDRRVLRLIGKWLKAGVLANVYLHYVYDLWVERWRRREARGEMIVVRYADDTIVGFQDHACAEQFAHDLAERLDRFALTLNADKTRLIEFGRFAAQDRARRGLGKPETFQFLGFTHICGRSRAGKFLLLRHTARTRLRERLRQIKVTLRRNRHRPIAEQGRWLGRVVNGYFAYHAVPTNCRALNAFYREVVRHWLRALRRRGQRHRLTYRKMFEIAATWLPAVRVRHPYPADRFAVRHPRWEPSA
jgi:group II intron reverse transcriptase/maturase